MSFGFGLGGRRDDTLIPAIVITVLFFALIVYMYVVIEEGRSRAYQEIYGDATPDPAVVAESVGTALYDGGDGRITTRMTLLLAATDDSPERGLIASPDEAVNYLYYTRTKRHITVSVMGSGRTSPVLTVIGPDGAVLARDDNDDGDSRAVVDADLLAEGHYTIRVSANAVDPDARSLNYSLNLATPGYFSPWEWEKLLSGVPILIAVLILILGLLGKLFGFSVKRPVESMRWYLREQAGLSDPPSFTYPAQTALVQPPPPEEMPEFEIDLNGLSAESIADFYYGGYPEEEEADDDV